MRNLEPPAKSKIAARGIQNGKRGLEMALIPGYWSLQKTFPKLIGILIRALLL